MFHVKPNLYKTFTTWCQEHLYCLFSIFFQNISSPSASWRFPVTQPTLPSSARPSKIAHFSCIYCAYWIPQQQNTFWCLYSVKMKRIYNQWPYLDVRGIWNHVFVVYILNIDLLCAHAWRKITIFWAIPHKFWWHQAARTQLPLSPWSVEFFWSMNNVFAQKLTILQPISAQIQLSICLRCYFI